ncbi:MAG: class I tRNA ligase family protein, partial [Nitrospinota bacterium]
TDLSSFYLDICKDRIYTMKKDSVERRAGQTTLFELTDRMVRIMAPVLSFTAEEVWQYVPGRTTGEEKRSVHTELFPKVEKEWVNETLADRWEKIIQVRKEVSKVLEGARKNGDIGHSLDATVTLFSPGEFGVDFLEYKDDLSFIFITSQVLLSHSAEPPKGAYTSDEIEGLWITVNQAPGEKCERCWRYSDTVGSLKEHPAVCTRCGDNL